MSDIFSFIGDQVEGSMSGWMKQTQVITDQVSNHKTTHVRYLSRKERQVAPEWLNPMFLARNPADGATFMVGTSDFVTPRMGIRTPGVAVAPYMEPARAWPRRSTPRWPALSG